MALSRGYIGVGVARPDEVMYLSTGYPGSWGWGGWAGERCGGLVDDVNVARLNFTPALLMVKLQCLDILRMCGFNERDHSA